MASAQSKVCRSYPPTYPPASHPLQPCRHLMGNRRRHSEGNAPSVSTHSHTVERRFYEQSHSF